MRCNAPKLAAVAAIFLGPFVAQAQNQPPVKEIWEPVPRVVTPGVGAAPPSDAIVLFDGTDLSQWQHADGSPAKWIVADGAFTVVSGSGALQTKRGFGDAQLHIEWRTPARVEGEGSSLYFHDWDNHLFELHTGTLETRLERYAKGR